MSSNSPKKRMNEFVVEVKTNSFLRFLGEFEDTQSPFEILWPLPKAMKNGPFSFFGGHIYDMPVFCHNFFTFSTIYNLENIDVFSVIKTLGSIIILLLWYIWQFKSLIGNVYGIGIYWSSDLQNVWFGWTSTVRFRPNDRTFFCRI